MAWKRSDWNAIVQQVNDLIADPPSGCPQLDALEEVGPSHKWSAKDFLAVRSRLFEMCNYSTFIAFAYKWKRDLIDEINAAISNGWCGCEDQWTGPYTVENPLQHEVRNEVSWTQDFDLGGQGWNPDCCQLPSVTGTDSYHGWDDVYYWPPGDLQIGPAGIAGRTIKLHISGIVHHHYQMHQWVGEVNGGFDDWTSDFDEPFAQEGGAMPLALDGYLRRPNEVLFRDYYNHIQDTQSNCVSYEFHGETILTCTILESYIIVDRP